METRPNEGEGGLSEGAKGADRTRKKKTLIRMISVKKPLQKQQYVASQKGEKIVLLLFP